MESFELLFGTCVFRIGELIVWKVIDEFNHDSINLKNINPKNKGLIYYDLFLTMQITS